MVFGVFLSRSEKGQTHETKKFLAAAGHDGKMMNDTSLHVLRLVFDAALHHEMALLTERAWGFRLHATPSSDIATIVAL